AAMARFFGREDTAFVEDWTAGWGITGVVRRRLNEQNILYAGGIVGDGIGSYVSGLDRAAGPGVAQLETLEAYGGHIGLSQLWRVDQFTGDPRIWSTVAAGYVHQGDSSASSGQAM